MFSKGRVIEMDYLLSRILQNIGMSKGNEVVLTPCLLFPYSSLMLLHLISVLFRNEECQEDQIQNYTVLEGWKKDPGTEGQVLASMCGWWASQLLSDHLGATYVPTK